MQAGPPCLWRATDITRVGIKSLGYESLETLWADYTVMALIRNPYDRAGSSYDYILGRREVRPLPPACCLCCAPCLRRLSTVRTTDRRRHEAIYASATCAPAEDRERSSAPPQRDLSARSVEMRVCVQDRAGHCRDPKFEHFAARPYVIGLQDKIFGCGEAVHDFYHVEPQYTCLLDDADRLVVDHIVRCPHPTTQPPARGTCESVTANLWGGNDAIAPAPVLRLVMGHRRRPVGAAVTPSDDSVVSAHMERPGRAARASRGFHGDAFNGRGTHGCQGDASTTRMAMHADDCTAAAGSSRWSRTLQRRCSRSTPAAATACRSSTPPSAGRSRAPSPRRATPPRTTLTAAATSASSWTAGRAASASSTCASPRRRRSPV